MPELLPATRALLRQTERLSGHPLDVDFQDDLSVPATAKLAGHEGRERHQLLVHSDAEAADYLISWQCGLILWHFRHPPERRRWLLRAERALTETRRLLQEALPDLPEEQRAQLATYLADGILLQLRSLPVGLLIDTWLYRERPELHPGQHAHLLAQGREQLAVLAPEQDRLPARIVRTSRFMSAAQALHTDRLFDAPELVAPYRTAGLEIAGRELLALCPDTEPETVDEHTVIDQWAGILELDGWYRWTTAH